MLNVAMAGVTVIMVTHKPVLVEKFDLSLELMRGGVKVRSSARRNKNIYNWWNRLFWNSNDQSVIGGLSKMSNSNLF